MRRAALLLLAASLAGCTHVTHLRNAKTGQAATCGGEMWNMNSAAKDEHCLKIFHQQGFEPTPD